MAKRKLLTNGNAFKRTDGRWGGTVWGFKPLPCQGFGRQDGKHLSAHNREQAKTIEYY